MSAPPERATFEVIFVEDEKQETKATGKGQGKRKRAHGTLVRRCGIISLKTVPGSALHFSVLRQDGGDGEAEQTEQEVVAVDIEHVFVPESARGKGHAETLVKFAFHLVLEDYGKDCKVIPSCTYVSDTFLPRFPSLGARTCTLVDLLRKRKQAAATSDPRSRKKKGDTA